MLLLIYLCVCTYCAAVDCCMFDHIFVNLFFFFFFFFLHLEGWCGGSFASLLVPFALECVVWNSVLCMLNCCVFGCVFVFTGLTLY